MKSARVCPLTQMHALTHIDIIMKIGMPGQVNADCWCVFLWESQARSRSLNNSYSRRQSRIVTSVTDRTLCIWTDIMDEKKKTNAIYFSFAQAIEHPIRYWLMIYIETRFGGFVHASRRPSIHSLLAFFSPSRLAYLISVFPIPTSLMIELLACAVI